jgi:hypothetical protein
MSAALRPILNLRARSNWPSRSFCPSNRSHNAGSDCGLPTHTGSRYLKSVQRAEVFLSKYRGPLSTWHWSPAKVNSPRWNPSNEVVGQRRPDSDSQGSAARSAASERSLLLSLEAVRGIRMVRASRDSS